MKKYAVIYEAHYVNDDYIVFIPYCISEGKFDKVTKTFSDTENECYKHINSIDVLTTSDYFYSLLIDEDYLLKKYNTEDIETARGSYFEEVIQNIIVGRIDFENGSIKTYILTIKSDHLALVHACGDLDLDLIVLANLALALTGGAGVLDDLAPAGAGGTGGGGLHLHAHEVLDRADLTTALRKNLLLFGIG